MAFSYKGAITFGMVFIPVTLSLCVKNNDIGFNMIDKKTMSRVKYKKTCVDCGNKEVKNEDIVKGYQYEKDKYVIFTDEEFEKLKTEKDKNITILQFANEAEIDTIFFDKSYYINPTGGEKAYAVLVQAMEKEKKVAIAKTVLGTKESLILLRTKNGKMLLSTLYFNEEIQKQPQIKSVKTSQKELDLAVTLINQMTERFKPEKFKDNFNLRVKRAIKSKIQGKQIIESKKDVKSAKIINLMEALQMSLSDNKQKKAK